MPAAKQQNRKLVLSPTRMMCWLECHLQYKLTYIDRLSKFYYKPNRHDTFGAVMHRTLQLFHEAGGVECVDESTLQDTLEKCWVSAGYESEGQEQEFRERGREIVRGYWRRAAESRAKTLFIEKQFRHAYPHFSLMGRLDRLDEHVDGTLEIIDYKSGRSGVTEEDVRESLAMACYSLLVKKRYPDRGVLASIVSLDSNTKATAEFSQDELTALEEDTSAMALQIMEREEFEPNYGPWCEACIYQKICYKEGQINWEEKRKQWETSLEGSW